jgi:hypothetical protein
MNSKLKGILILVVALALPSVAQQIVTAPAPAKTQHLIGTGLTAPGALMFGLPMRVATAKPTVKAGTSAHPVVLSPTLPPPKVTGQATPPAPAKAGSAMACPGLVAKLEKEVKENPEKVLEAVRRALLENDACACDIVKTAIRASSASSDLVGQITEVAVTTVPARYKEIVECVVSVSPQSKAAVRAALARVFGSKDGKGGKEVVLGPTLPPVSQRVILDIPRLYFPPPPVTVATPTNPVDLAGN